MNASWPGREWPAAVIIVLAALATELSPVTAAETRRFGDYPAARTHYGPAAPAKLRKQDLMFRTRLRAAAKKQPNFAGNFVLEIWGCGTTCLMGAAVNVATGKVVQIPFSICCARAADPEFNAIEFRPNSRLIIFAGLRNEEEPMGAHYYEFDGHQFQFIFTVPDEGSFTGKGRGTDSSQSEKSGPTLGEPAFKVLPEWCQHGDCFTWTIEGMSPIASAAHGVLFEISSQEWEASYADRSKRSFNQTTTLYVFCSKQMPAFLESGEEGLQATFLAPNREDDYGHANEIAYSFYFAVCHGKLLGSAGLGPPLAREYGYNVERVGTQPLFARPEDILTYDPTGRSRRPTP